MAVRPEPTFTSALVTGANGFIGRAMVRRLVMAGVDVTCTSRRDDRAVAASTRWVTGDVNDGAFIDALVASAKPDVIFHLAGHVTGSREVTEVRPTLLTNLFGTVNVLLAANATGCDRVVLIGSGDEPTSAEAPCSPYAAAKAAQTGYGRLFHSLYGTPVTTARIFMAFGPDQPDATKLVPHTITSLLRSERPLMTSGRRRCDWIYVDDVVDALVALAGAPDSVGRVVDVGTGSLHTVRHVVDTIAELVEPVVGAAVDPAWGELADRPGETEYVADPSLAIALAGWRASTDLRAGLAQTVNWYVTRSG